MGRKHKHPEHENHERWLVSYADFITLLFATFTALYAIATNDLSKISKAQATAAAAISQGFQDQSILSGIKSIMKGQSPPNASPNPMSKNTGEGDGLLGKHDSLVPTQGNVKASQATPKTVTTLKDLLDTLAKINEELQSVTGVQLKLEAHGIRITFDSTLLFDSGSASLRNKAIEALKLIGERLRPIAATYRIEIEGHTDNQPIASPVYPSNWELSTARACSVVRTLIDRSSLPSRQLAAVGYADTRPKASNQSEAGRIKNRRIDIWVQGFPEQSPAANTIRIKDPSEFPDKPSTGKPLKPVVVMKPVIASPSVPIKKIGVSPDIRNTKPIQAAEIPAKPAPVESKHGASGFVTPRFESITDLPGGPPKALSQPL